LESKKAWRLKAEKIERSVLHDADHVINVSQIWKSKYEDLYPEIEGKSSLIHNGYDEDDFEPIQHVERNQTFTIGYNGTYSRIVPMNPLVSAITEIHNKFNISIRLRIATPIKKKKLTAKYPYLVQNNLLDHSGFLPHKESLKNLNACDVSLLILNDIAATEGMIPAKTFEYLRINRPILLLHRKDGFLAEIISKTNTGTTADIADHDGIVQALLRLHQAWRDNELRHHPDWDEIKKFDRKYLSQKLVDIFNTLT
jgi:glycosyltransferase involved in cell wall biosynthesis